MKNSSDLVTSSGTITSTKSKKMGVSAAAMGPVMEILSNMYEDGYEAVLREYAANGLDSHISSGVTKPIEVTLPSDLQPTLIFRDFGCGLSQEQMFTVYAEYGVSTKGDDNDTVGGFGIGAKAAFTLGQQFIVTSVKAGQKTTALFSLDEDNVGQVEILWEGPTTEEQGVTVSLAVENVDRMRETAVRVFGTWDKGTVLVDGHEPVSIFDAAHWINETTAVIEEGDGRVYATLGPVAYPISKGILEMAAGRLREMGQEGAAGLADTLAVYGSHTSKSLYFRANVGDMKIKPDREGLRDTDKTVGSVASHILGLSNDLLSSVQAKVDACRTTYEAAATLRSEQEALKPFSVLRKDVTFGGSKMPKVSATVTLHNYILGTKNWRSSTMVVQDHPVVEFEVEAAAKAVVVTGVPKGEEGTIRRFAKRFLENSEEFDRIIVTDADAASYGWFTFGVEGGAHTMTRDDYRAVLRSLRTSSPRLVNEPSYTVGVGMKASRDLDDRDLLTDIIAEGRDIVIAYESCPGGLLAEKALADYTVVVLLATQSEDALRKRVEADGSVSVLDLDVRTLVRQQAQTVFDSTTPEERDALGALAWLDANQITTWGYRSYWENFAQIVGADLVPQVWEIRDAYELARLVAADISTDRRNELNAATRVLGSTISFPTFDYEIPDFGVVYPLLSGVSTSNIDPDRPRSLNVPLLRDVVYYLLARNA